MPQVMVERRSKPLEEALDGEQCPMAHSHDVSPGDAERVQRRCNGLCERCTFNWAVIVVRASLGQGQPVARCESCLEKE